MNNILDISNICEFWFGQLHVMGDLVSEERERERAKVSEERDFGEKRLQQLHCPLAWRSFI